MGDTRVEVAAVPEGAAVRDVEVVEPPRTRPEEFPPEVHASLRALQAVAAAAKTREDPGLRRATAEEVALSELLRRPDHCSRWSGRTGLACRMKRLRGMKVCKVHGGQSVHNRRRAERRAALVSPNLLERQVALAMQDENLMVAHKAAADVMDRAGVGAVVRAKVRASKKQEGPSGQVIVNIGFLTKEGGE